MITISVISITGMPIFDYAFTLVLAPTMIFAVPYFYLNFIKRG